MAQQPTIGRVVHYHSYDTPGGEYLPEPRAAIITAVECSDAANEDDWKGNRQPCAQGDDQAAEYIAGVSLCVLNPTGMFFTERVHFSEEPRPGCWSWPTRA
ncbi:MAG: hypothetical protein JWM23_553 [Microbacteriaceae bacterium]|nr:hypothetical protein [Microbacteriaceae bacterium]